MERSFQRVRILSGSAERRIPSPRDHRVEGDMKVCREIEIAATVYAICLALLVAAAVLA